MDKSKTLRWRSAFVLPVLIALAIFASPSYTSFPAAAAKSQINLGDLKQQLLQYKQSGAYDRDVAATLADAQRYVEQHAGQGSKTAIILDIDETALLNWPEMQANDFGYIPNAPCDSLPAGPCGVRNWEQSAQCEVIRPTLDLFKAARVRGVSVFFITGRPDNERTATEANLHKAGYDGWAGLILRPAGLTIKSAADFKAPERAKIASQGFRIIANIGDQPSDLAGGYAEKTFLIPNPFYRVP